MLHVLFICGILSISHCNANIDSSTINRLLNASGNGHLKQVFVDKYVTDVLVHLLMSDKVHFATALSNSVSSQCRIDSVFYMEQRALQSIVPHSNPWALKMYESSGRSAQGVHEPKVKNRHAYGLFDECLNIHAENNATRTSFRGHYCTVFFRPTLAVVTNGSRPIGSGQSGDLMSALFESNNLFRTATCVPQVGDSRYDDHIVSVSSALCLPSSCTPTDVRRAVADLVGHLAIAGEHNETFVSILTVTDTGQCYVDSETPIANSKWDHADMIVLMVLSMIALLVLVATIQELVRMALNRPVDNQRDGLAVRGLHCFSALNNTRQVMNMRPASDAISCLAGIRFLTSAWITFGHVLLSTIDNNITVGTMYQHSLNMLSLTFMNATTGVDTFFVMSGMLASLALLRQLQANKGKLNIISLYLHRYLRLTPVYAIILAFLATLVVHCAVGPNWNNVRIISNECRSNWWINLLYLNNVVGVEAHGRVYDKVCMRETWFLANDMQFFIISPLLVYPMWRWKRIGFAPLVTLTLASLLANIEAFASHDVPMTLMPKALLYNEKADIVDYYKFIYEKPWIRAAPYFVGLFLGWAVHETKRTNFKLDKRLVIGLWASAAASALLIVYGIHPYMEENQAASKIVTVLYGSFHRFIWAIAVSWVIYACAFGYGGVVNEFLCWPAFIPLSRLNYCVYLINLNYIMIYAAFSRTPNYYSVFSQFHYSAGIFASVYIFAFIVSISVESSFLNLEKAVTSLRKTRQLSGKSAHQRLHKDESGDAEIIEKDENRSTTRRRSAVHEHCVANKVPMLPKSVFNRIWPNLTNKQPIEYKEANQQQATNRLAKSEHNGGF